MQTKTQIKRKPRPHPPGCDKHARGKTPLRVWCDEYAQNCGHNADTGRYWHRIARRHFGDRTPSHAWRALYDAAPEHIKPLFATPKK